MPFVMQRLRRYRWFLLGALVGIGAALVFLQTRDGGDARSARAGSRIVEGSVARPAEHPPRSYAVRYRTETHTDAGTTATLDAILVRRPFEARVRQTSSSGPSDILNAFGVYSVGGQAFHVPPGAADADRSVGAILSDALDRGYAEAREVREVIGLRCRVYRFGDGSEATNLSTLEEADTYTDVCVDATGIILEEATFDGSDLVRRRVALEIDRKPRIDDDLFDLDVQEGDARQLGSVQELEDDSRLPGDEFWQLPGSATEPVDGFELHGRFAVVPPGQPGFSDITSRGNVITFMSEVWVREDTGDVIVIDQGGTQGSKPFEPDPNGAKVEGGELGDGELLLSMRESEIRFLTGGVRFVRIRGNVAPSRLLAVAWSPEAVDGGPLRPKD